jgi:hypothetical protein
MKIFVLNDRVHVSRDEATSFGSRNELQEFIAKLEAAADRAWGPPLLVSPSTSTR